MVESDMRRGAPVHGAQPDGRNGGYKTREEVAARLKGIVRTVPDFPSPGILFRDITTALRDADALRASVDAMAGLLSGCDFDLILGPESRGFIYGVPVAYALGKGFVPVRKAGKLPCAAARKDYALEYGTATIEIHRDAICPGQRAVIVDDLLATGGTAKAVAELVGEMGGQVAAMAFLIELEALNGRQTLEGYAVRSLLQY